MSETLIEEGLREAAEDRRIASMFRRPQNRNAMLRRAAVTEELVGEIEDLNRVRLDALRTLSEVAAGMTDDAYDALRGVLTR